MFKYCQNCEFFQNKVTEYTDSLMDMNWCSKDFNYVKTHIINGVKKIIPVDHKDFIPPPSCPYVLELMVGKE